MSTSILNFPLPRAAQAPGSAPAAPTAEILTDDARLRVGVFHATRVLKPAVASDLVNLRRLARLAATAIVVNAPAHWTVAELAHWLTTDGPDGDAE